MSMHALYYSRVVEKAIALSTGYIRELFSGHIHLLNNWGLWVIVTYFAKFTDKSFITKADGRAIFVVWQAGSSV